MSKCAFAFNLSCGDPSYEGNTALGQNDYGFNSPELFFVFEVKKPTLATLTTCPVPGVSPAPYASWSAYLRLFEACPLADQDASVLAENDPNYYCAYVTYVFHNPGAYWFMLEGRTANSKGAFRMNLQCLDAPSPVPTPLPSPQPTPLPTTLPTAKPSPLPSALPTKRPTPLPSVQPTPLPSGQPTPLPSMQPTPMPSPQPTPLPSAQPTPLPTARPSPEPTSQPTPAPSDLPVPLPSPLPSSHPTPLPSSQPTPPPSAQPTPLPSAQPTILPSPRPTAQPTPLPSSQPSLPPTPLPTSQPTPLPTSQPTPFPSAQPTALPSSQPTPLPSAQPTPFPTLPPTPTPSPLPTVVPTPVGTVSLQVTLIVQASSVDDVSQDKVAPALVGLLGGANPLLAGVIRTYTVVASSRRLASRPALRLDHEGAPAEEEEASPERPVGKGRGDERRLATTVVYFNVAAVLTEIGFPNADQWLAVVESELGQAVRDGSLESAISTNCACPVQVFVVTVDKLDEYPTFFPTVAPTPDPTLPPTPLPTLSPSLLPSPLPTLPPSPLPTLPPSWEPTAAPSYPPTPTPSMTPASRPSPEPTQQPNPLPSSQPTPLPTQQPSPLPTAQPSPPPSAQPTPLPSAQPTPLPSAQPTSSPTSLPTDVPSLAPTAQPTRLPTPLPTSQPTEYGCRFGYLNLTCGQSVTAPLDMNLTNPEFAEIVGEAFAGSDRSPNVAVFRVRVPVMDGYATQVTLDTCGTSEDTILSAYDHCPDPWGSQSLIAQAYQAWIARGNSFTSFTEVQLMQVAYAYLDANALAWDDGGADCGNGASIVNLILNHPEGNVTTSDLYVLVQADQDPESEAPPAVNINLDCRVATPAPTQLPTSPPTPVPTFEFVRVVEVTAAIRLEFASFGETPVSALASSQAFAGALASVLQPSGLVASAGVEILGLEDQSSCGIETVDGDDSSSPCADQDDATVQAATGGYTCAQLSSMPGACDAQLCPTCSYAHACDASCGLCPSSDDSSSPCVDKDDATMQAATGGYSCSELVALGSGVCSSMLCPTCNYKHSCDSTCGFCVEPDDGGSSEAVCADIAEATIKEATGGVTCRQLKTLGQCATQLCPTCLFAHACDLTCGFCDRRRLTSEPNSVVISPPKNFTRLPCGGTAAGVASYTAGNSEAEEWFLVSADAVSSNSARFLASTCSPRTAVTTSLRLFARDDFALLAQYNGTSDYPCAVATADVFSLVGSPQVWVAIGGFGPEDQGAFELTVACAEAPSPVPTPLPSEPPSLRPTGRPSAAPAPLPTSLPTFLPTSLPTTFPTSKPVFVPTGSPSIPPTGQPTTDPTSPPLPVPSSHPIAGPSAEPTMRPTKPPSALPTEPPSFAPTDRPSHVPTLPPSPRPSHAPTPPPSRAPTPLPTICTGLRVRFAVRASIPVPPDPASPFPNTTTGLAVALTSALNNEFGADAQPGARFSQALGQFARAQFAQGLYEARVGMGCCQGQFGPTFSLYTAPIGFSVSKGHIPTPAPTPLPTLPPSELPTTSPTNVPSPSPTHSPSEAPSAEPTPTPSPGPTHAPTASPSHSPTEIPTPAPTAEPTPRPSADPTLLPFPLPTISPTMAPTAVPLTAPTPGPTLEPTPSPSRLPTQAPTPPPTPLPTARPSLEPTEVPSVPPTQLPTLLPTPAPSPAPTTVLRGYKDCVCFSASLVGSLKIHCPKVAQHFAADSCAANVTAAEFKVIAADCPFLQD